MRAAIAKAKAPPPPPKKRTPAGRDRVHREKGRLPDKASFLVIYDAGREMWVGNMTIPGLPTLSGEASGVFSLIANLDDTYRTYIRGDHADRPG